MKKIILVLLLIAPSVIFARVQKATDEHVDTAGEIVKLYQHDIHKKLCECELNSETCQEVRKLFRKSLSCFIEESKRRSCKSGDWGPHREDMRKISQCEADFDYWDKRFADKTFWQQTRFISATAGSISIGALILHRIFF